MRRVRAAGALVVLGAILLGSPAGAGRVVDLDQPGVLEAFRQSNPAHYSKIEKIRHSAVCPSLSTTPGTKSSSPSRPRAES